MRKRKISKTGDGYPQITQRRRLWEVSEASLLPWITQFVLLLICVHLCNLCKWIYLFPAFFYLNGSHIRSYHQNNFAKYLEVVNPICLNHKRFHCIIRRNQEHVSTITANVL